MGEQSRCMVCTRIGRQRLSCFRDVFGLPCYGTPAAGRCGLVFSLPRLLFWLRSRLLFLCFFLGGKGLERKDGTSEEREKTGGRRFVVLAPIAYAFSLFFSGGRKVGTKRWDIRGKREDGEKRGRAEGPSARSKNGVFFLGCEHCGAA